MSENQLDENDVQNIRKQLETIRLEWIDMYCHQWIVYGILMKLGIEIYENPLQWDLQC